jgi:hypothetical protein
VSFYEAMILLDDVVHLLAWPPFAFLKQQLLPLQVWPAPVIYF